MDDATAAGARRSVMGCRGVGRLETGGGHGATATATASAAAAAVMQQLE
jgi:hypothetical protein